MTLTDVIILAAATCAVIGGLIWFRALRGGGSSKKLRLLRFAAAALASIGGYIILTRVVALIFGSPEHGEFQLSMWPERRKLFGLDISETVVYTWIIMAALVITSLILRFTVLRRLTHVPRGAQNVLETAAEYILKYMDSSVHGLGELMGSYLFSVSALLLGCAALELFGFRTPASDITFTFGLALITFFLINWYGFKRKGAIGRVRSMMKPTPIVFPIKIVTDLAIPVSLACRLFGNMLGGLVIIDLLYFALGSGAIGIPSAAGLFFNVFHPVLQGFIFVTLTLKFIGEAVE